MSKINSSLRKLSGDPKTTSSVIEPVQLASTPGMTLLKVVFVGLILEGYITHFPHCVLIKQVQAAAAVHEDSSEVKSVNDWVKNQCGESAMEDASGVVPSIKSDRAGRPWVELWGDWLHRIYVP